MSVKVNTYVMFGVLLDYKEVVSSNEAYEKLEPYMDGVTELVVHIDGLCCLYDGMNGRYVAIGAVLAKTDRDMPFDEPIVIPSAVTIEWTIMRSRIKALLPHVDIPPPAWMVISHHR